jgi:shikimate dehydrogenase
MKGFGGGAGTRRFAVLGFPARHSLSPRMHRAAFRALGIDASYEAIEVAPERLGPELDRLAAEGFEGLNLTTPLKERAVAHVSRLTPEAERVAAVNTLRLDPEGWTGHATDGLGFEGWVREGGIRVGGSRVLLLGAGGAARSIAPNLVALGPAAVDVVSRSGDHARELAERMRGSGGALPARAAALEDAPGPETWNLLVRFLSASDVGSAEARWWSGLVPGATVLEGNYAERAAGARARAAASGLRFEDGLGLLLHQGARSFEFWTGAEAPVEVMRNALLRPDGPGV